MGLARHARSLFSFFSNFLAVPPTDAGCECRPPPPPPILPPQSSEGGGGAVRFYTSDSGSLRVRPSLPDRWVHCTGFFPRLSPSHPHLYAVPMDARSMASTAQGGRAAPRPPKFQARCNSCSAKLTPTGELTSCRHFICEGCLKGREQGVCPVCKQDCRTVQLSAPNFPQEIKERSNVVVDEAAAKAVATCRMQNSHLAQISERQSLLLQRAYTSIRLQRQSYKDLEVTYKRLNKENAVLRDRLKGTRRGPKVWGASSSVGFPAAPSTRSASVASSLLGKTLMQG
eukprot:TRINITY_DN59512_c0_g1_i1.p1 TRINITY_DN59512_c0_g1~~TRINITY_DN59512_c0_g1_i1.p1  ORF type:complete len:285 (+),score=33.68 TRINITY_DN59512_c0_g1_i1:3-857(+)